MSHKWASLPEEAISHGPYSLPVRSTLTLYSHSDSSVKELIHVKINHFSDKLVLIWWRSCLFSVYCFTISYISKREETGESGTGGGRNRSGGVQAVLFTIEAFCQLVVFVKLQCSDTLKSNSIYDSPWNQCSEPIWLFKGRVKCF